MVRAIGEIQVGDVRRLLEDRLWDFHMPLVIFYACFWVRPSTTLSPNCWGAGMVLLLGHHTAPSMVSIKLPLQEPKSCPLDELKIEHDLYDSGNRIQPCKQIIPYSSLFVVFGLQICQDSLVGTMPFSI
ncbi:hypothetical protein AOQ84DRAFT_216391 [Glonium stellatum]|uniref:Uncharacterized protein n=1 Tax=Glonium stellatum TaxID=574774 RepID=A0A8E2JLK8_9PEZI|nr:hypothetical protein AOQ84DRAFT_216391 [Glonium stellatum]